MEIRSRLSLFVVFLTLLLVCAGAVAQDRAGGEVLTNDKVITMVKAGLLPSIIVNKIHASKTNFNTSTDELIRLQTAKVPSEIINAMVDASSSASTTKSAAGAGDTSRADPNDPLATHEAGIYLFDEIGGKKH